MDLRLCFACAVRVLGAAVEQRIDILDPEALHTFFMDQAASGEPIKSERELFPGVVGHTVIPLRGQVYCAFHLAVDKRRRAQPLPYAPPPVIGRFDGDL